MLVTKCDLCKRVIKNSEEITAGFGWKRYSLCVRCAEPIVSLLRKRKLLQPVAARKKQ
jgi:hypothetical protein